VRYVMTNIDTSLASTDEEMMKLYAGLVENQEVKKNGPGFAFNGAGEIAQVNGRITGPADEGAAQKPFLFHRPARRSAGYFT